MISSAVNTEANLLTGKRKQWIWKQQSFSFALRPATGSKGVAPRGRGVRAGRLWSELVPGFAVYWWGKSQSLSDSVSSILHWGK